MSTLIIPCAGRSTRFPNMRPKWLLTHPKGELMIEKAIDSFDLKKFSRVIFTVVKEHDEKYEAVLVLNQSIKAQYSNVEICILDEFTSGPAETIFQTLKKMNVGGSFVVKDADNFVGFFQDHHFKSFLVGLNLEGKSVSNIAAKSFILKNEQNTVLDIIEKRIVSNHICLGVYGFDSPSEFMSAYQKLTEDNRVTGELFLSHVVSYLISIEKKEYQYLEAEEFEDWGTLDDWNKVKNRHRTFIFDIDGVIFRNSGKFGSENWSTQSPPIHENVDAILGLIQNGAQIILMTSREEAFRQSLETRLADLGIDYHALIMGCHHAQRVIVNDFANSNPFPSCAAISVPRNSVVADYLKGGM